MKKRIYKIILLSAVMLLLTTATALAKKETLRITSDSYQIDAGESFTVDVYCPAIFNGVDIRMTFNSDRVEISDETSGIEEAMIYDEGNTVYMNASFVNAAEAKNGNMLSVTFKAKENVSGNAGIAVQVVDLFYNDENYNAVNIDYRTDDQIAKFGGVLIGSDTASSALEYEAVAETGNGEISVKGLPDGSTITVTDKTSDAEIAPKYLVAVKESTAFSGMDNADIIVVYEITADNATEANGKYTVAIPLAKDQDYDQYYVGQEIDGEIKWTKVQVQDGQIIYTTDQLGEIAVAGTKGSSTVSEKYDGTLNGISENGSTGHGVLLWIVLIVLVVAAATVIIVLKRKKKKGED